MSAPIRFFHRGQTVELDDVPPTRTVLQWLREDRHCTGTKEGCAEGDCGACTVVIGEWQPDGDVRLKAVNSCLLFVPTLDGRALFTIEDLQQADGRLHPVQQALVDCHASQCGFCTPGFAMSLWALYQNTPAATVPQRGDIEDALSGNLCRCTGYQPIVNAAQRMSALPAAPFDARALAGKLGLLARDAPLVHGRPGQRFHAPRTLAQLIELRTTLPAARIVAGATDVGLWVTKQMRELGDILSVGEVAELKRIETRDGMLRIGAGASLETAYAAACAHWPPLRELWRRFASRPVRNAGTLGGNVANGSPIGDSMPWLLALDASIVLNGALGQRALPLSAFYLGYQQNAMRAGEFVEALEIPLPPLAAILRVYKLSKRRDQDISAVCAAFSIALDGQTVRSARLAFGGMAAIPKRAAAAEAALLGKPWNEETLTAAMQALASDFQPLTDMRASAGYRMRGAQNLLRRFWLETRPDRPLPAPLINVFECAAS